MLSWGVIKMASSRKELDKLMTSSHVRRRQKRRVRIAAWLCLGVLLCGAALFALNLYVTRTAAAYTLTQQQTAQQEFDHTVEFDPVRTARLRNASAAIGDESILLVVPEPALARAVFIARRLGLMAYGVPAPGEYANDPLEVFRRAGAVFVF